MKNQNIDTNQEYKYGFTTDIENISAPKGLSEESVKFISNINTKTYKSLPKFWSCQPTYNTFSFTFFNRFNAMHDVRREYQN